MFKISWILMSTFLSFSALAEVSFEEKKNRVEYLEALAAKATSMNIDDYRRELRYEKQDLPLSERAANEANILAEKIKVQIQKSYDLALKTKTPDEARAEVRHSIQKDLNLIAPELQDEIQDLAMAALENIHRGEMSLDTNLGKIEAALLTNIQARSEFLNQEGVEMSVSAMLVAGTYDANSDSEKKVYKSKYELLESLASDRDNSGWASGASVSLKSIIVKSIESKISMRLKAEFMGISVDAGPTISFSRDYNTNINIIAEGMNPPLKNDGNFDYFKRDRNNQIVKKDGKEEKRAISFACESSLVFATEYSGRGSFQISGIGASSEVVGRFVNSVSLTSRRIAVPETILGTTATYKYLTDICNKDFLQARVTNNMTVSDSLNKMMENIVASLRFSHSKTKCITDTQCKSWFTRAVPSASRSGNVARCIEDSKEKFRSCEIKGLRGQNCAVLDSNGKRLSDGANEFSCDAGLRCYKVQEEGWLRGFSLYQHAKGKCY